MSDTWYRDPPDLPPYEDGFGKLWTLDGTCLNPDPPVSTFLDDWPEDLRWTVFQTSVVMELADAYERQLRAEELALMWGAEVKAEFLAVTEHADGLGEVRVVYDAIEAREEARPRRGPRGFLGGGAS